MKKKELKKEKKDVVEKINESEKKKAGLFVWWLFWIIYLEMIYRIFIIGDFFSFNTLSVIEFSIPTVVILTILTSLFNGKVNRVLTCIYSALLGTLVFAQIVYFNFYHSIFSFFSLTTGAGQVMQFWQRILEIIGSIWYILLLIYVPLILSFIFAGKFIEYKRGRFIKYLIYLVIMNFSILGIILQIKTSYGLYCLEDLLYKTQAPMLTINKTGLFAMEGIDVYRYLFGFEEQLSYDDENYEEAVIEPKVEYNITKIDFDKLISKTTDKTIQKMHKYFK